jgi:ABC-2 type transport system permease protein
MLVGFLFSTIGMPHRRLDALKMPLDKQAAVISAPYHFAEAAMIFTMIVVAVFYALNALYAERRDRSILFWKSLPVSDTTTVLAKAFVPFVIMPTVTWVITVATQLVMLLLSAIILAAGGAPASAPGAPNPAELAVVLLYGLVTMTLWYAPIYGWMLMVSAWARRAPFLWAFLPPLAVCLLEKIALNTSHLFDQLATRLGGSYSAAFVTSTPAELKARGGMPLLGLAQIDPGKFLSDPGLWVGLVVGAAFIAAAVWFRRRREPI